TNNMTLKQQLELLNKEFTNLKNKLTTKLQTQQQTITDTNQKLQESNHKLELTAKENTENEKVLEKLIKEFKEEEVLREWNNCQAKIHQLKAKSIDNYPRVKKISLLQLFNSPINDNKERDIQTQVNDIIISNGVISHRATNFFSNTEVSLFIEKLEVIVLQDLTDNHTCSGSATSNSATSGSSNLEKKLERVRNLIADNQIEKLKRKFTFPPKEELARVRKRIARPGYRRVNIGLLPNATESDKVKYHLCLSISRYQDENDLSEKELAQELEINKVKLEYILFRHLDKLTLEELVDYLSKLPLPFKLKTNLPYVQINPDYLEKNKEFKQGLTEKGIKLAKNELAQVLMDDNLIQELVQQLDGKS
ncbi:23629_t:CDS:2, partial [Gigaspora margarita]